MENTTALDLIRQQLGAKGAYQQNKKEQLRAWLSKDCAHLFNCGLTLMPKKRFYKHVPRNKKKDGKLYVNLSKNELEAASLRFIHILNQLTLKKKYTRFNKSIPVLMTIEGEKSCKDLHSHFAIGKPSYMTIKEFAVLVKKAIEISGQFEQFDPNYDFQKDNLDKKYRYKLDVIDNDWLYYITKELDSRDFHNLYLP